MQGGVVVVNDMDPANLGLAAESVRSVAPSIRVVAIHGNFADAPRAIQELGLRADMVLADLGFASTQVDDAARGLSFSREGPLDMRMDPRLATTAADLVASLPEAELVGILREFGEERQAGRVARAIVAARAHTAIRTTTELADLVRSVVPRERGPGAIDPATRTFQALRIAVNDELGSLSALLSAVRDGARAVAMGRPTWLNPGARVAIIAFHSLEDRPVKQAFRDLVSSSSAVDVTGGVETAGEGEVRENPRSRSAKLRAIRLASG
jgi:16S rRNA (cytosine1402-N4)-methyltransferase